LAALPDVTAIARRALAWFKQQLEKYHEEVRAFGNFPSYFMGLVSEEGGIEHYDGTLRVVDAKGRIVSDRLDPTRYQEIIGEAVESWTYLKFPYYKPAGYPEGMVRVGPLARLNIIDRCDASEAGREWEEFRRLEQGPVLGSFHYHYARLIEVLYALERLAELLNDKEIISPRVRAVAEVNNLEGIGVAEAPRGTLVHHYRVNEQGLIVWVNLVIATGHNNLAMNEGILQAARHFVRGVELSEGMLNRVEAVIRTFDPCLSCSTHALGRMPLRIQLVGADGTVLDELTR
jgi:NAD-reducing hydrogenase large subunit